MRDKELILEILYQIQDASQKVINTTAAYKVVDNRN